jgi:hypothetical protein
MPLKASAKEALLTPIDDLPLELYISAAKADRLKGMCAAHGILLLGELLANSTFRLKKNMHTFGKDAATQWQKFLDVHFVGRNLQFRDFEEPKHGLIIHKMNIHNDIRAWPRKIIKLEGSVFQRQEALKAAYRTYDYENQQTQREEEKIHVTLKGPFNASTRDALTADLHQRIRPSLFGAYREVIGLQGQNLIIDVNITYKNKKDTSHIPKENNMKDQWLFLNVISSFDDKTTRKLKAALHTRINQQLQRAYKKATGITDKNIIVHADINFARSDLS